MTCSEPMSLERLADEMRSLAGQVVLLYGTELARLHGVAEDATDLYYITESRRNGLMWHSAVGGVTPIKDRLGEDYDVLEAQFVRDGIPARPFQVVRSVRFAKEWLEGRPDTLPDEAQRIRDAFDGELEALDRSLNWRAKQGADAIIEAACAALKADGLEAAKIESFRRQVSGQYAQAHPEALTDPDDSPYAYALDALKWRRRVLRIRAGEGMSRQWRVILDTAKRYGSTLNLMPVLAVLDRKRPRHNKGQDLLNDLRHICDEILGGRQPTYEEERDDPILKEIAEQLPMLSRFLGIWLEGQPELTATWAERGTIPVWLPAAAFCIANWKRYADYPQVLGLNDAQVRTVRADLAVCRKGS